MFVFSFSYRRIIITNNERDNTLKTLLIKPVPTVQQTMTIDVFPNRQTKRSINKKLSATSSSSQPLDSTEQNGLFPGQKQLNSFYRYIFHSLESRPMIMSRKELDELAYLLHANAQRNDYEQIDNPAKVEERKFKQGSRKINDFLLKILPKDMI